MSGGTFGTNWLDLSSTSNRYVRTYIQGFMDISGGNLIVRNNNLYLTQGDASINGNLILGYGASINGRLVVGSDLSVSGGFYLPASSSIRNGGATLTLPTTTGTLATLGGAETLTNKTIVASSNAITELDTNNLSTSAGIKNTQLANNSVMIGNSSVSLGATLTSILGLNQLTSASITSTGDTTSSRMLVSSDSSFNGNVYMDDNLIIRGNLSVQQYRTNLMVYTVSYGFIVAEDMSLNGRLFVRDDISANSRLYVGGDASFGSKVFVASDLSVNGRLLVNGVATFVGQVNAASFNATSDYRIKTGVRTLDNSYNVNLLKPVVYNNEKLNKKDIGFLAHEVQEQYPFLVSGEKDGENLQTLNYIGIIGILTKEIQELKKENVKIIERLDNGGL